jgi:hypothetical protein
MYKLKIIWTSSNAIMYIIFLYRAVKYKQEATFFSIQNLSNKFHSNIHKLYLCVNLHVIGNSVIVAEIPIFFALIINIFFISVL